MGLFSSTKKTYVSSVVYNMAGPLGERTSYLKSTVARAVLTGGPNSSLGEEINASQINGPTFSQRMFYRWARDNYPEGQISGKMVKRRQLNAADAAVASGALPVPAGHALQINTAIIDSPDLVYWAERYLLANDQVRYVEEWKVDSDGAGNMVITFPDTTFIVAPLTGFKTGVNFLYVYYSTVEDGVSQGWNNGAVQSNYSSRPDTASADPVWIQSSYTDAITSVTLTQTTTTTVDDGAGPPSETVSTSDSTADGETSTEVLDRTVFMGADPAGGAFMIDENRRMTIWERYIIDSSTSSTVTDDGAGTVTTVEVETEYLEKVWDYRTDIEKVHRDDMSQNDRLFIYELGSGTVVLDALEVEVEVVSEFFPVIPLRRHNKSISDPEYAGSYGQYSKAFKRIIGQKVNVALDEIESNENIDDIDHATLVFGVELNTIEDCGLRYLYTFFKGLMTNQASSLSELNSWISADTTYELYLDDLAEWQSHQSNDTLARYGDPRPSHSPLVQPDISVLTIKTSDDVSIEIPNHFNISWSNINEEVHAGLGKAGAVRGDMWWEVMPDYDPTGYLTTVADSGQAPDNWIARSDFGDYKLTHVRLHWQDDFLTYRVLDIWGMVHENIVYEGKSVIINARAALEETDESGFIVPLHYPTLKLIPVVMANELALSNRLIVFNSYQTVTTRWYQKGVFKFIFAIVIAVVAAFAFPGAIGILGANAAVGASLGLAAGSVAALVAGAVANAIAAMILTHILTAGAVALFGEKFGALIASIAGIIIMGGLAGFDISNGMSINWGEFMKIDNLMKISGALSNGVSGYTQASMKEIQAEMERETDEYDTEMDRINREAYELLGGGLVDLDPISIFTDIQESAGSSSGTLVMESSDTFIRRTLLTGSDLIDLSNAMITDYADITLKLPEPSV